MTDLTALPGPVRAKLRDEAVPDWRAPTLATLTDKRFNDPGWIFERKFDGANQNCITLHTWQSRKNRLHNPDRLVFDLDPSDPNDFAVVRATAHAVAEVLGDLGLARYVQTTGSRGLHVVVPLRADTDFDTARQFARDLAEVVAADDAAHRTLEVRKDKRGGRVYLDVMRNAYGQTSVAPYSVRARPGAPVATPLGGTNWVSVACVLTDLQFAISPNDLPDKVIRGPVCPGTPAH